MMRNIGLRVNAPRKSCSDKLCPFHGELGVKKRMLTGTVASTKMSGTVTVERDYLHYVPKYLRYERRRSRIMAHSPPCLEVEEGDRVVIAECRPLSKEVSFVVVERLSRV
ncbi:MAG: 30S ribosomal protein S17 [Candidatus Bathyarchaeia archaeon]